MTKLFDLKHFPNSHALAYTNSNKHETIGKPIELRVCVCVYGCLYVDSELIFTEVLQRVDIAMHCNNS